MPRARSGGFFMTAIASVAVAVAALNPADFGAIETTPNNQAFAALFASLGEQSLQSPAPQHVLPPASISRLAISNGKFVPIPAATGLPSTAPNSTQTKKNPPTSITALGMGNNGVAQSALSESKEYAGNFIGERFFGAAPRELQLATATAVEGQVFRDALAIELEPPTPIVNRSALINTLAPPPLQHTSAGAPAALVDAALPVHHPRFAESTTQQITVMARDGIQHARISLNPAELGPVELRVVVRNDEAQVQLAAPTAAVREILEEALPRLREHFEQAGMRLSDSAVFQQLPQQSGGEPREGLSEREMAELSPLEAFEQLDESVATQHKGMIDAYV